MPEMDRASYVCFGPKYSLFLQMSRELRDLHNQKTQPGNTNHFTGVTSNEQLTKYFRARLVRSLFAFFFEDLSNYLTSNDVLIKTVIFLYHCTKT